MARRKVAAAASGPKATDRACALAAWERAVPALARGEHLHLLGRAEERSGPLLRPARADVFRALELTPPREAKVVILGQDPYHGPDQAHGLAFSVPGHLAAPPSLRNIFKELERDLGPPDGQSRDGRSPDLTAWAGQGVLLLNVVLTVERGRAGSHADLGWQALTDEVLRAVSEVRERAVFMLWGNPARERARLVDAQRHLVLEAAHPSPLSAWRGFLGCGHFSAANAWLRAHGLEPVRW